MPHPILTPYLLATPEKAAIPLLVDAPHSGVLLPEDFDFICSLGDLRQSDEFYVDQFGDKAVAQGGVFLKAMVTRAYIDLNRPIGELHPNVCAQPIPWPLSRSKRVMYGIGLIRHLVRPFEPVYAAPLPLSVIEARIKHYYDPYYQVLGDELHRLRDQFGRVLHLNLHGMPNIGIEGSPMPDIVLGDHDGHSCSRAYREMIKKFFESHGLKVVINNPYKGVELTRRFAKPRQGIHSLQIEINKALFMDETTMATNDGMGDMLAIFQALWQEIAEMFDVDVAKAAE